jgi:hypothetical protein
MLEKILTDGSETGLTVAQKVNLGFDEIDANTADRHTHSNGSVLDNIIDSGAGDKYLADDGTYKTPSGSGSGDMLKSTYDTNDNGIVDNAEKVNNLTVQTAVPAGAVFTDTTYSAGTGLNLTGTTFELDASLGELNDVDLSGLNTGDVLKFDGTNWVPGTSSSSTAWGDITGTLSNQTDLQNALDVKVDSDPSAVSGADKINNMMSLTQAEYDAIATPDPATLYVIV